MNPNVCCELWVVVMCQYRFINFSKCIPLVQDVDSEIGRYACVGIRDMGEKSILFTQFCCEPKLAFWASHVAQWLKSPSANAGNMSSIPGSIRSPGVENGNPLQYSCLRNPMTQETGRPQSISLQKRQI